MSFLDKIFPDASSQFTRKYMPLVDKINELEPEFEAMSDKELAKKAQEIKEIIAEKQSQRTNDPLAMLELTDRIKEKGVINQILFSVLPEAFAMVREATKRSVGQRHFDVQLLGGIALHLGNISEMRTGEGKTLVATLPLVLNALVGKGAHLITVNDYLAKHAIEWYGPVYHTLGLSVGVIVHDSAYIYTPEVVSQEEAGQHALSHPHLKPVTRQEAYGADITYGTNNEFGFDYLRDNMVQSLDQRVQREQFYAIVDEVDSILIDEARTPLIISGAAEVAADLYTQFSKLVPRLKAEDDYVVDEKDRVVTLTKEGIAKMESLLGIENIYSGEEIQYAYHLEEALKANILFKKNKDYVVQEGEVIIVDEFTGRMMPGRRYSEGLHQAIEAKEGVNVQRESNTLATISFQNLFRLYIKLSGMTGTAKTEEEEFMKIYGLEVMVIPTNQEMIRLDSPDRIYKTEAGKYKAMIADLKVRHESGQPVLIGTISVEKNEELSKILKKNGVPHEILNAKNHEREAEIITKAGRKGAVTLATNMAGRGTDIILGGVPPKLDDFLPMEEGVEITKKIEVEAKEKYERAMLQWQLDHDEVLSFGGLHVVGTERHESRRIDNQLRGRAGRQGDPGSSQFYISADDDLMRIFGGDKLKHWLEVMGLPEDEAIEHSFLSKAIESAQKKVEGFHFDTRKRLVEYDDVMNRHREVIYRRRYKALMSAGGFSSHPELVSGSKNDDAEKSKESEEDTNELRATVENTIKDEARRLVGIHASGFQTEWDIDQLVRDVNSLIGLAEGDKNKLVEELKNFQSDAAVESRVTELFEAVLAYKQKEFGNQYDMVLRALYLQSMDMLWMEHLNTMTELRTGIGLRGYAQTDPLVAYKSEGYRLFKSLLSAIDSQTARSMLRVERTQG